MLVDALENWNVTSERSFSPHHSQPFADKQRRCLLPRSTKVLTLLDSANQQASNESIEVRGKIKLGLLPETYEHLQPILFEFQDQYPQVELDIRNINNGFIDMFQQGLDIALHGGMLFDSDIVARKILTLDRCVVASPNYLQTHGTPATLEELSDHQCICFRWPNGNVDNLWHFQEQNVALKPKLISNNIGFIKSSTVLDRGISYIPKLLVKMSSNPVH